MRRTHTGNRMEIVAKKPPGWNGHHHPTTTVTTTSSTQPPLKISTSSTSTTTTTTTTTTEATTTEKEKTTSEEVTTTVRPLTLPATSIYLEASSTAQTFPSTEIQKLESYWTNAVIGKQEKPKEVHKGMIVFLDAGTPSSTTPWYLRWMIYKDREKLLIPIVGGIIVTLFIIIIAIIWMKRRRSKRSRSVMERMNTDVNPADKENLLKEPAGLSDEEQ